MNMKNKIEIKWADGVDMELKITPEGLKTSEIISVLEFVKMTLFLQAVKETEKK